MKVNIGVGINPINGYLNIDPLGGEGKESIDFRNLDSVCEQSECEEIRAEDVLNFVSFLQAHDVLLNWTTKLRHGGKIIVGGNDMHESCKSVVLGQLNPDQANKLFYGEHKHAWDFKGCMYNMIDIAQLLESFGLKVTKKRINGNKFIVEAYRE